MAALLLLGLHLHGASPGSLLNGLERRGRCSEWGVPTVTRLSHGVRPSETIGKPCSLFSNTR